MTNNYVYPVFKLYKGEQVLEEILSTEENAIKYIQRIKKFAPSAFYVEWLLDAPMKEVKS